MIFTSIDAPGALKSEGTTSPDPFTTSQAASSPPTQTQGAQSSSGSLSDSSSGLLKTLSVASGMEDVKWTSLPILSGKWEWDRNAVQRPIPDLLGLVALSVFTGVMLSRLGESGKALRCVLQL